MITYSFKPKHNNSRFACYNIICLYVCPIMEWLQQEQPTRRLLEKFCWFYIQPQLLKCLSWMYNCDGCSTSTIAWFRPLLGSYFLCHGGEWTHLVGTAAAGTWFKATMRIFTLQVIWWKIANLAGKQNKALFYKKKLQDPPNFIEMAKFSLNFRSTLKQTGCKMINVDQYLRRSSSSEESSSIGFSSHMTLFVMKKSLVRRIECRIRIQKFNCHTQNVQVFLQIFSSCIELINYCINFLQAIIHIKAQTIRTEIKEKLWDWVAIVAKN